MAILVINSGSSSLKVTLFHKLERLIDIQCKSLSTSQTQLTLEIYQQKEEETLAQPFSVTGCLTAILKLMQARGLPAPYLIGQRFVHGGRKYRASLLLDQVAFRALKELVPLAPLHNQSSFEGIEWAYKNLRHVPQVIVFDTTYFQNLPQVASIYAIPQKLTKKYHIERYGFHGISHQYIWQRYSEQLGQFRQNDKVITMHLGSGCSMTAIHAGKPLDTSMGFTPLEGLVMGTRSGDLDPSVVEFLSKQEKISAEDVINLLNFQSGLLGISGKTSDMSALLQLATSKKDAQLAIDLFCYRIQKYIGAYFTVLKGVDALIFSGGIGENSPTIRADIAKRFSWLGIELDASANDASRDLKPGEIRAISSQNSSIRLYVLATDENRAIAQIAEKLLQAG
jgi:acetate kinase